MTAPLEAHFCNFTKLLRAPLPTFQGNLEVWAIPQCGYAKPRISPSEVKLVSWKLFASFIAGPSSIAETAMQKSKIQQKYLRFASRICFGQRLYCLWPRPDYPSRFCSLLYGTSVCGAGELQWQTVTRSKLDVYRLQKAHGVQSTPLLWTHEDPDTLVCA